MALRGKCFIDDDLPLRPAWVELTQGRVIVVAHHNPGAVKAPEQLGEALVIGRLKIKNVF